MMKSCDFLIIGSGPAGQKAAIQGAKAGLKVVVVESEPQVGGMCVHKGTIPSKALRESARRFSNAHELLKTELPTELSSLMSNVEMRAQDLESNQPNPAWQFRCAVWDLIVAHADDLDVDEMRSTLEDVVFEYHEHCGAGRPDT